MVASNWRAKKLRFAAQQTVSAIQHHTYSIIIHAHTHHSDTGSRAFVVPPLIEVLQLSFFLIGLRRSQRVLRRPIKRARTLRLCFIVITPRSLCILKAAV